MRAKPSDASRFTPVGTTDLESIRRDLTTFDSLIGRHTIDPELLIRKLIIGYCFALRPERRSCEKTLLNLTRLWLCRPRLDENVVDHSTFSCNRHGRFLESDLFRRVFKKVLPRYLNEVLRCWPDPSSSHQAALYFKQGIDPARLLRMRCWH